MASEQNAAAAGVQIAIQASNAAAAAVLSAQVQQLQALVTDCEDTNSAPAAKILIADALRAAGYDDDAWTEDEFRAKFIEDARDEVVVAVTDRATNQQGFVCFVDEPRVYFSFMPDTETSTDD